MTAPCAVAATYVSVLYREPKVLKPVTRSMLPIVSSTFQCSTVSRKY